MRLNRSKEGFILSVHNSRYSGYLLVHFIGEQPDGEQVYFSYSEDGLHWKDLNAGLPVLRSELGEKGVRDPFLVRSPKEDKFYLIATDLRIANGKGWSAAVECRKPRHYHMGIRRPGALVFTVGSHAWRTGRRLRLGAGGHL